MVTMLTVDFIPDAGKLKKTGSTFEHGFFVVDILNLPNFDGHYFKWVGISVEQPLSLLVFRPAYNDTVRFNVLESCDQYTTVVVAGILAEGV